MHMYIKLNLHFSVDVQHTGPFTEMNGTPKLGKYNGVASSWLQQLVNHCED